MKRIAIVATLVAAFTFGVSLPAHAPQEERYKPCPTEDSVGCYWDGKTMGNGHGRSYIVTPGGELIYTDGK